MTPEFPRSIRIDTLGSEPRRIAIDADETERKALAKRFGLVEISRLEAEVDVSLSGDAVAAAGTLRAAVVQSCVATGEPLLAAIDEPFQILFRPPPTGNVDEEVELGEADMDVIFYDGASIDLGEAVAESLALSLDPFPRAPNADEVLREAGVESEAEAGPFSVLASLKDKLKRTE